MADEDLGESMSVLLQLERLHVDTTKGAKPLQVFHGRPTRLTEPPDLAIELSATAVGNFRACCPDSPFAAPYIATALAGTISAQVLLAWRVAGPSEEVRQTDRWNAEALRAVRELASDLRSLLTSLEVAPPPPRRGQGHSTQLPVGGEYAAESGALDHLAPNLTRAPWSAPRDPADVSEAGRPLAVGSTVCPRLRLRVRSEHPKVYPEAGLLNCAQTEQIRGAEKRIVPNAAGLRDGRRENG
jgi:hypothetical protein